MKLVSVLLVSLLLVSAGHASVPAKHIALKSEIETRALRYFLDHAHPVTGLVRDKADAFGPTPSQNIVASIAATGFGLAVVANAADRGLISRSDGEAYALRVLRFSEGNLTRHKGWFLHFVDWSTGSRIWKSEVSTIDTALFLAGALYAGEVLGGEVKLIANRLYEAVDFHEFMTDGGRRPGKRTLSLSYTPESGFSSFQWSQYAEQMILLVLGLGHPTHPLPEECWDVWRRQSFPVPWLSVMAVEMPLFIHQYSHAFLDFRSFSDGYASYFENSVRATRVHRVYAGTTAVYRTLREGFWGFSAGESPTGYSVYSPLNFRGTVCIGCAVASAMFLPHEVLDDAEGWRSGSRSKEIWGIYGFIDGLDLDRKWASRNVLGITVGPAYMAMANAEDSTSIWRKFMRIEGVKRGLERAAR